MCEGIVLLTINDFFLRAYFGEYNGVHAIMISIPIIGYPFMLRNVTIAGAVIRYVDFDEIWAWKDGKEYSLQEAYNLGVLTWEDIHEIADRHNSRKYFLWDLIRGQR